MAYCKNCGMPIDEKKDIRCPRCGEFTDGTFETKKKDSGKTIVIILLCVLVLLCLFCFTFMIVVNRNITETPVTDASQENVTTIIVQNNQYNVHDYTPIPTADSGYNNNTYEPVQTTSSADVGMCYFVAGENGIVSFNTPAHAGVKLRRYNDIDSEAITVLSEGSSLTLDETTTIHGDKYVRVTAVVNGKVETGYVLAKYITGVGGIADDGKGDDEDNYKPVTESTESVYHISYNTPEGKGLNVRSEATYYSDLIVTLPEGTPVTFVDKTRADGYWYIGAYLDGTYYEGYVLSKYIDS